MLIRILTDGHHLDKSVQINDQCGYCGRYAGYHRGNYRCTGQRKYLTQRSIQKMNRLKNNSNNKKSKFIFEIKTIEYKLCIPNIFGEQIKHFKPR